MFHFYHFVWYISLDKGYVCVKSKKCYWDVKCFSLCSYFSTTFLVSDINVHDIECINVYCRHFFVYQPVFMYFVGISLHINRYLWYVYWFVCLRTFLCIELCHCYNLKCPNLKYEFAAHYHTACESATWKNVLVTIPTQNPGIGKR